MSLHPAAFCQCTSGNILQYLRHGNNSSKIVMDSLSYKYNAATNQLNHVRDSVPDNDYPSTGYIDIDNQNADNYGYDAIGNLIRDDAEGVTSIEWNVYGKITKQSFSTTTVGETKNVYYYYDAAGTRMGKRNEKVAASGTTNDYLWYVRDASGNVMATYNSNPATGNTVPNTLSVKERHLFGSSRLGIYTLKKDVKATPPSYTQTTPYNRSWLRGYKSYELSNHLGNVLSTITDIKFGVDTNSDGVIDYYTADVAGASDYYPFGATLPNRSTGTSYRYGFNGKEKDKEGMTQYDYGFRIEDPRLGRFKSVDPITSKYPELTPYQFASNTPIQAIDIDGLESYGVYNIASGQLSLIPDISKMRPKLTLKFVSAFEYENLTAEDKSKANYGILIKNVFTGGHYDANSHAIVNDDARRPKELPISTGTYNILENKGNTVPEHNSFFVLDPVDTSPYDKVDDRPGQINSDGEKRSGYNFHPGRVSWGCVTVCSSDESLTFEQRQHEWEIVNKSINGTKSENVPDNRGLHKYKPFSSQIKFGILEVINTPNPPPFKVPEKSSSSGNQNNPPIMITPGNGGIM